MRDHSEAIHLLESEALTDVLVGGFVDRESGAARFHPMLDSVYLRFGKRYLRCLAEDQEYAFTLEVMETITRDFPIEEEDEFCVASLFGVLLGDGFTARPVITFRAIPADASGRGEALSACEFLFEDAEGLRIEPMIPHGLRLSSTRDGGALDEALPPGGGVTWTRTRRHEADGRPQQGEV